MGLPGRLDSGPQPAASADPFRSGKPVSSEGALRSRARVFGLSSGDIEQTSMIVQSQDSSLRPVPKRHPVLSHILLRSALMNPANDAFSQFIHESRRFQA